MGRSRIREALNRVLWDEAYDPSLVEVVYLHRDYQGRPGYRSVRADMIESVGSWYLSVRSEQGVHIIPFHRVIEIRDIKGRVLWRRDRA